MAFDTGLAGRQCDCAAPAKEYIGIGPPARAGDLRAGELAMAGWLRYAAKPCNMGMRRPVAAHGSNPPRARMTDAAAPVTPPALRPVERRDRDGCRRQALAEIIPGRQANSVRSCARGSRAGRAQALARGSAGGRAA